MFSQNYFQQQINFNIQVKLDDKRNVLIARESIVYINNSPDTLYFIYFHLWPNAYKDNNTALVRQQLRIQNGALYFAEQKQRGYIDSLNFTSGNKQLPWEYDEKYKDICKVYLQESLLPGDSITIETPFYVKLPDSFSRLGHYGQSYQITQWYPKPAVYDNAGWHQFPYLDMGEFYSEFGNYDVQITVPRNYVVAATGNLQNQDEISWLNDIFEKTKAKTKFSPDNSFPPSDSATKTICFKQNEIHDFAWFADKRFNVLKGEVVLPHSGRKVTTWIYFTGLNGNLWKDAIEYVNNAVYYYSLWVGDYPYDNCTAVDGALSAGGGMEYPTITIIGDMDSPQALEQVIVHEVGHNWWYGILASNEREYPWIDEGINSFYETRYTNLKHPGFKMYQHLGNNGAQIAHFFDIYEYDYNYFNQFLYIFNSRRNLDQPCTLTSDEYLGMNYEASVYLKTASIFTYLHNYLGSEKFDSIMGTLFDEWKFRNLPPDAVFSCFKKKYSENLDCFFDGLLSSTKKVDYKICSAREKEPGLWNVNVRNLGKISAPFTLTALKNGEPVTDSVKWLNGFRGKKSLLLQANEFDKIALDNQWLLPDKNRKNNTINRYGILKKWKPVRLQFLAGIENPEKNQLFWLPAIGWNNNDKFMPGIILYNGLIPVKKFEYLVMPMYGTGSGKLCGIGRLNYNIFPIRAFQYISLGLIASRFSLNNNISTDRLNAYLIFKIKKKHLANPIHQKIRLNVVRVNDPEAASFDSLQVSNYYNFNYHVERIHKINTFSIDLSLHSGTGFVKSSIEAKYFVPYQKFSKGLSIRLFAGKFLYNSDEYYGNRNFRMSSLAGYQDYTVSNVFFDRAGNTSVLSKQFYCSDGGFVILTPLGQSNNWLAAINFSASLPVKAPLRVYANFGTYPYIGGVLKNRVLFEGGIELVVIPKICSIYFPAALSHDLKEVSKLYYDNYLQKIRFTLKINFIDPYDFIKEFGF